jgi:hypothetical protein
MSDYCHIMFERQAGKVKSFSTASGSKSTRLTIVLEITDSYALSNLLRELHEAQHAPKAEPAPASVAKPKAKAKRPALAAPPLQLPYFGEDV